METAIHTLQRLLRICAVWLLGATLAPLTWAQPESDPPGRVGRLSEVAGQVWLYAPDAGEWTPATRNRPLTAGERLSTDPGGRAEVHIGSTTLRLDSDSELEVLQLDDQAVSLQLHQGSMAATLRDADALGEFELKTGEGLFRARRTGRYRLDRIDGSSHLTVYNGEAHYQGRGSALTVYSGQRAEFWIDAADTTQYSITEPQRDAFSAWSSERDRADRSSVSTRYVSQEMTGVQDLDRHGRWEETDEYGALWIPRGVAPGWAPYSAGYWTWVSPWGWTWVDDAPWGFAPFHYGRWVWHRNAWCWSPGRYVRRPVYAPALVAWVGGPSLSVSVTIGDRQPGPAVGWFPLAPREVYLPSYRVSPRYVRNINVTHVTNVTRIDAVIGQHDRSPGERDYRNRKFPHAVTVVPASVVAGRQPVAPAASQWRNAVGSGNVGRDALRGPVFSAPPVQAPTSPVRRLEPGAAAEAESGGHGPFAPQRRWSHPIRRADRTPDGQAAPGAGGAAGQPQAGPGAGPALSPPRRTDQPPGQGPGEAQPPARWQGPPPQTPPPPALQAQPPASPAHATEPRLRSRPVPGRETRPVVVAPSAPPAPGPQAAPRAQPKERPTPEKRHHGRPPEEKPERAADKPVPAPRAEARPKDERTDRAERRPGPRDRKELQ